MGPRPRRTTSRMPKRLSSWPASAMSRRNFVGTALLARCSQLARAARGDRLRADRGPVARCGEARFGHRQAELLRRHSRIPPSRATAPGPRFTASISSRPSLRPLSTKSSTTMSSAGMLPRAAAPAGSPPGWRRTRRCPGGRAAHAAAGTGALRLAVLHVAIEFVGLDVDAPQAVVARAADHDVVQRVAFGAEARARTARTVGR